LAGRYWAALGAEVAAAFRISLGFAASYMRDALAMRERLPQVKTLNGGAPQSPHQPGF
jgi:hypothetical protein